MVWPLKSSDLGLYFSTTAPVILNPDLRTYNRDAVAIGD